MRLIEGQTFAGLRDRVGATKVQDVEFRRCHFRDCFVSTEEVVSRPCFRNINAIDSEESNCHLSEAVIEDATIEGLRVKDLFITSDCAFKHVMLKGKIGPIKIGSGFAGRVRKRPKLQSALDTANSAFYERTDWALDISKAEFEDFSISGVPLSLVRLDGETQVVLSAAVTQGGEWRAVPEFAKTWGPRIDALMKIGRGPELLLVAAKGHRDFKVDLDALNALRRAGLIAAL